MTVSTSKCDATAGFFRKITFIIGYQHRYFFAELATGAMVIDQIKESGKKISMLVANNKSNFSKKASGRITFTCTDGHLIKDAIQQTIATSQGQTFWMKSIGVNENGDQVSEMDFEWSVRLK